MAHEKASLNLPLIVFFAVLSVVTLAALQPAFNSYFGSVAGAERHVRQEARASYYEEVAELREVDEAALARGPMSIGRAMTMVQQGRAQLGVIQARPFQNREALAGWSHHPGFEALVDTPAPPADVASETEQGTDGAAVLPSDDAAEPASPQAAPPPRAAGVVPAPPPAVRRTAGAAAAAAAVREPAVVAGPAGEALAAEPAAPTPSAEPAAPEPAAPTPEPEAPTPTAPSAPAPTPAGDAP